MEQLSMYSAGLLEQPPMWECMKTCKHFGESKLDDYFPATKIKRCNYGIEKCGCTGKDMLIKHDPTGRTRFLCKFYEVKEPK